MLCVRVLFLNVFYFYFCPVSLSLSLFLSLSHVDSMLYIWTFFSKSSYPSSRRCWNGIWSDPIKLLFVFSAWRVTFYEWFVVSNKKEDDDDDDERRRRRTEQRSIWTVWRTSTNSAMSFLSLSTLAGSCWAALPSAKKVSQIAIGPALTSVKRERMSEIQFTSVQSAQLRWVIWELINLTK